MIVLDTNVLSVVMHPKRSEAVSRWFKKQPAESLWITAITIFEASFGIEQVDEAKRRHALRAAFDAAVGDVLQGRILSFDAAAAYEAAKLVADRRRRNRTVELRDTQIAGIVRARKATLATRNTRDFADAGVPLVDPWRVRAD
jgi:predicted nucleic acid-binding protein